MPVLPHSSWSLRYSYAITASMAPYKCLYYHNYTIVVVIVIIITTTTTSGGPPPSSSSP